MKSVALWMFVLIVASMAWGWNLCLAGPIPPPDVPISRTNSAPPPGLPQPGEAPPNPPGIQPPAKVPFPGDIVPPSVNAAEAALQKAADQVKDVASSLTLGAVRVVRGPVGDLHILAGLCYEGRVVAVLHIDPSTGELLPAGLDFPRNNLLVGMPDVRREMEAVTAELEVVPVAQYRAPEACWVFPIVVDHVVVAYLAMDGDGSHVRSDPAAGAEMENGCP